jgi:hypothetical protein
MPEITGHAVRRRDERLSRIRRVSLWVAGGAAATALGLGTAFAHALPGHAAVATGARPTGARQAQPGAGQAQPGAGPAAPGSAAAPVRRHNRHQSIAPPQQLPVTTQAPPQTVSGGS